MKRSTLVLWLLHLLGNALLLWFGYAWLGLGESDTAHLLGSALIIFGLVSAGLWMHGTAFVYFDRHIDAPRGLRRAMTQAARHLLPLLAVALCAFALYSLLAYLYGRFEHSAFLLGSYATLHTRQPVAPANVLHWYHVLIWILRWLVLPVLLLPLMAAVARSGWAGFRLQSLHRSRSPLYWIEVCLLLLLAIVVPLRLLNWIPLFSKFAWQMASFAGRIGLGYLLFVAALLAIEFFTSRGRPRLSQPSTAALP